MKPFLRFIDLTSTCAGKAAGFVIVSMMFITGLEVVLRYFFGRPTSWTNEVCQYLLIGSVMLGATYTQKTEGHIFVEWLTSGLSRRTQAGLDILALFLGLIFWGLLAWQGVLLAVKGWGWRSDSILEVRLIYAILVIPVGSALMCLQLFGDIVSGLLSYSSEESIKA